MLAVIVIDVNSMKLFHFFTVSDVDGKQALSFFDPFTLAAVVVYLVSMFFNYFSYYMCMAFTIFIRRLSNNAGKLKHNASKLSNTLEYQKLIHASSRVAIAFLCSSALYVILSALEIVIAKYFGIINSEYDFGVLIIMMAVFFPCILSFVIVFLLPKAFLSRLLRKWKFSEMEKYTKGKTLDKKSEQKIDIIVKDRFPFVKIEVLIAIVTIIVDVVSILISLKI